MTAPAATAPMAVLLVGGVEQWDRPGRPLHDPEGLQAFVAALREARPAPLRCIEWPAHINDAAFCEAALQVFDDRVAQGLVPKGAA